MRITLKRGQIRKDKNYVGAIDTTVKSATKEGKCLAPTWEMVLGHKAGKVTDQEYTNRYEIILNKIEKSWWDNLFKEKEKEGTITFLCYCRDEWFCHTHLIIENLKKKFPDKVLDGREIKPKQIQDEFKLI